MSPNVHLCTLVTKSLDTAEKTEKTPKFSIFLIKTEIQLVFRITITIT